MNTTPDMLLEIGGRCAAIAFTTPQESDFTALAHDATAAARAIAALARQADAAGQLDTDTSRRVLDAIELLASFATCAAGEAITQHRDARPHLPAPPTG